MRKPLMASAAVSAFAHLLGMGAARGARAEDDDTRDDDAKAEADGDDEDEDEDLPKDAKKSKKAKAKAKAEDGDDDDDDAKAEDDGDDEDPPKDARKSKKAKAKAEDDDGDEDDDESERAKGAKAERARWTRVLSSSAAAGGRIAAACEMLSGTTMKASAVIATLNALPAATGTQGLGARMARVATPNVGSDGGSAVDPNSAEGKAAAIVAAGKKRRGEL